MTCGRLGRVRVLTGGGRSAPAATSPTRGAGRRRSQQPLVSIHSASGATPIWLPAPSSPIMVPMVWVPWPSRSQGPLEQSPSASPPVVVVGEACRPVLAPRYWFTRAGWAYSMPESTLATVMPAPVAPSPRPRGRGRRRRPHVKLTPAAAFGGADGLVSRRLLLHGFDERDLRRCVDLGDLSPPRRRRARGPAVPPLTSTALTSG